MMSVSFDPFTKLENVPQTPKQRYEIMTKEIPKDGKLSLHMMYQTCGTQINLDYISEKDFIKKFLANLLLMYFAKLLNDKINIRSNYFLQLENWQK